MKNIFELKHSTPSLAGRVRGGSLYFRQALHMMKEEKLFSGIYIVGTAVFHIKSVALALKVYHIALNAALYRLAQTCYGSCFTRMIPRICDETDKIYKSYYYKSKH
jgi:hypothetical protein